MTPVIIAVIVTAIITFIAVASWSGRAKGVGDGSLAVASMLFIKEMDTMAKELGHEDMYHYWLTTKGKEYADKGIANITNTIAYINR